MPTLTAITPLFDLEPGRVVFLNKHSIDTITGSFTSPATLRIYVTGESVPEVEMPIEFPGHAHIDVVPSMSSGVKDADVIDSTGASTKVVEMFEVVPRAQISSASPDPVSAGERVTVLGNDLEYATKIRINHATESFDFQSGRATFDSPWLPDNVHFGGGASGGIDNVNVIGTGASSMIQFTMPDVGVEGEFRLNIDFQIDFDAADGPDETFYSDDVAIRFSTSDTTSVDPTPASVDPSDFSDRVICDSTAGSDTLGAGVEHAPFATIAKAIESTTGNVLILLNHGEYHERVSVPMGRVVWIIGRGISIIHGDGVRSLVQVESGDGETEPGVLILENITLVQPPANGYFVTPKTGIGNPDGRILFANCVLYTDHSPASAQIAYLRDCTDYVIELRGCTVKGLLRGVNDGPAVTLDDPEVDS